MLSTHVHCQHILYATYVYICIACLVSCTACIKSVVDLASEPAVVWVSFWVCRRELQLVNVL